MGLLYNYYFRDLHIIIITILFYSSVLKYLSIHYLTAVIRRYLNIMILLYFIRCYNIILHNIATSQIPRLI